MAQPTPQPIPLSEQIDIMNVALAASKNKLARKEALVRNLGHEQRKHEEQEQQLNMLKLEHDAIRGRIAELDVQLDTLYAQRKIWDPSSSANLEGNTVLPPGALEPLYAGALAAPRNDSAASGVGGAGRSGGGASAS